MGFIIKSHKDKVLDHAVGTVLPSMRGEMEAKWGQLLDAFEQTPGMGMRSVAMPEPSLANIQQQSRRRMELMNTGSGYMPEYGMVPPEDAMKEFDRGAEAERREFKTRIAGDPKLFAEAEASYKRAQLESKGLRGEHTPATRARGKTE